MVFHRYTPSTFIIAIDRFFDFDRPLTHLRTNTGDSFAELQRFQKTEGNWKGNEWRFVNSDVFIRNSMLTQQLQLPGEVPPSISNALFWFSSLWWGIYRKWKSGTLIFVDIRLSTLSPFLVEDKEKNVPWSA